MTYLSSILIQKFEFPFSTMIGEIGLHSVLWKSSERNDECVPSGLSGGLRGLSMILGTMDCLRRCLWDWEDGLCTLNSVGPFPSPRSHDNLLLVLLLLPIMSVSRLNRSTVGIAKCALSGRTHTAAKGKTCHDFFFLLSTFFFFYMFQSLIILCKCYNLKLIPINIDVLSFKHVINLHALKEHFFWYLYEYK